MHEQIIAQLGLPDQDEELNGSDEVKVYPEKMEVNLEKHKRYGNKHMVGFVFSVFVTQAITAAFWTSVELLHGLYVYLFVSLVFIRWIRYYRKSWLHFCLDFCYFANFSLIVFLVTESADTEWFIVEFCICNSIVGPAAVIFRNKVIFASMDHMTSVFIHIMPAIIVYSIRWFDTRHDICDPTDECFKEISVFWFYGFPSLIFLAHTILYCLWVECLPQSKMQQDPNYLNSFRMMLSVALSSRKGEAIGRLPPHKQKMIFYSIQCAVTSILNLLSPLYYHSQFLHTLFIMLIIVDNTLSGGRAYVSLLNRGMHKNKQQVVIGQSLMNTLSEKNLMDVFTNRMVLKNYKKLEKVDKIPQEVVKDIVYMENVLYLSNNRQDAIVLQSKSI